MSLTIKADRYTFIAIDNDATIYCHRDDEPWLEFSQGSKAIIALMYEVEDLKNQLVLKRELK
jgi:hypothetical protein